MPVSWYAIRSKPNKEDFLAKQLTSYGINVYYPRIQVKTVNPRARKFKAFFPGYLFVEVNLETVSTSVLRWMPGASGLVMFGGEPASVPDSLILALKKQIDHHNTMLHNQTSNFQKGDLITIENGPFRGYEGIFDIHISGQDRVRVLLNLLQNRNLPIEINSGQIRRVKRK